MGKIIKEVLDISVPSILLDHLSKHWKNNKNDVLDDASHGPCEMILFSGKGLAESKVRPGSSEVATASMKGIVCRCSGCTPTSLPDAP